MLDEYASRMGSHQRIYAKLSIILFLCCVIPSLRNILIGSPTPSYLFSSPMGFCQAQHGLSFNGLIGLSPNLLYPDLVRNMHEEK
jgi:hypothetical protein